MIKLKAESLFHIIQKLIANGSELKISKEKVYILVGNIFFFLTLTRKAFFKKHTKVFVLKKN